MVDSNSKKRLFAYYKLMLSDDNGQVDDKKAKTSDYGFIVYKSKEMNGYV